MAPRGFEGTVPPFAFSISAAAAQTVCRTLATEQDLQTFLKVNSLGSGKPLWTRRMQHFKFVSLAITFRSQRVKKQKYIVLQMEAIFVRAPGGIV